MARQGKARQRGNKKVPGTHSQATTKVYANTHHTHTQVKTKEPENGDPSNQWKNQGNVVIPKQTKPLKYIFTNEYPKLENLNKHCTNTKSHLETNMRTCKHKYWGSYTQTMVIGGEARKWRHSHTRDLTLFGFTRRQHELGLGPSTWENHGIVNCGDQETSWRRLSSKSGWPREGLGWLV